MEHFKGKVVLLTGGSRGLGPVLAESIAKQGASIVLAARSKSGLDDVATGLRAKGTKILTMPSKSLKQSGTCIIPQLGSTVMQIDVNNTLYDNRNQDI